MANKRFFYVTTNKNNEYKNTSRHRQTVKHTNNYKMKTNV